MAAIAVSIIAAVMPAAGGLADQRSKSTSFGANVLQSPAMQPDCPLLGLDNVLLTPHLAARTYTAIENMSWVVRDVVEVLNGRTPKSPAP